MCVTVVYDGPHLKAYALAESILILTKAII